MHPPPIAPPPARVLVDASALVAIVDPDDPNHERARQAWDLLRAAVANGTSSASAVAGTRLATAALEERLATEAAQALADIVAGLRLYWVTEYLDREAGVASLGHVDTGSYNRTLTRLILQEGGVDAAFSFDPELAAEGTAVWP